MDTFKKEAFYQEFPFIKELGGDHGDLKSITVKRISAELLNSKPYRSVSVGSLVGIDEGKTFVFMDKNGYVLDIDPAEDYDYYSNYAYEDPYSVSGESILEAIHRSDLSDKVHFIVAIEYGYNVVNHHSESDWSMTIYKPAKGDLIPELISKAQVKAKAEVEAEANF